MAQHPKTPRKARPSTRSGGGDASPVLGSRRGRPRLTPEDLNARRADYCERYGAQLNDQGLPPFPAGQRETEQHREWMALYKAHRRLSERGTGSADLARRHELLVAQRGRCPVCDKRLDVNDARLNSHEADPAVLHAQCLQLLALGRILGADALARARARL